MKQTMNKEILPTMLGANIVLLKGFPPAKLAETIEALVAAENTSP